MPTETEFELHKKLMPTSADLITEFLRRQGGRFTSKEIALKLDMPVGTSSSALYELYRAARNHGGAGVYGFKNPENSRQPKYAWRSSRPNSDDLWEQKRRAQSVERAGKGKPRAATPAYLDQDVMTLKRSHLDRSVWAHEDGSFYRLVPVKVRVEIVDA